MLSYANSYFIRLKILWQFYVNKFTNLFLFRILRLIFRFPIISLFTFLYNLKLIYFIFKFQTLPLLQFLHIYRSFKVKFSCTSFTTVLYFSIFFYVFCILLTSVFKKNENHFTENFVLLPTSSEQSFSGCHSFAFLRVCVCALLSTRFCSC